MCGAVPGGGACSPPKPAAFRLNLLLPSAAPHIPQVSIVPRGSAALGFAQYLPNENMLMTTEQVGGRPWLAFWCMWWVAIVGWV